MLYYENTLAMKSTLLLAVVVAVAQGFPRAQFRAPSSDIVGGEPAAPNEIPYIVSMRFAGGLWCGGSIVNERHVITAAHCAEGFAQYYSIVAGEYSIEETDGTEQNIAISEIFIHEDYENGDGTNANDIAILRLATPLVYSDAVQPIALPKPGHISSGMVQTAGWGALRAGFPGPDVLHKVQVPIVDDAVCEQNYEAGTAWTVNGDIQICAGYLEGGKDSCQGDSGGPLTAYDDGEYLAGVVSWGKGCAEPDFPGVYTEVVVYLDWINSIINN